MRTFYADILKKQFSRQLVISRAAMHLTQPQMADVLGVCLRSYANLDHGIYGCSGLTLARYLIYCCPNPMAFLDDLYAAFEADDLHLPRISGDITAKDSLTYRYALPVTESALTECKTVHPVCPRCGKYLDEDQNFCSHCGQKLDWRQYAVPHFRFIH